MRPCSLAEDRERYGPSLKVASLAAVPKDPAWDQVRVVHDATHGVEVNHQIRLVNQMRFPLFDDLEATMAQFLSEADGRKLVMAFDYKGAHRLVPIHEDDWGKQAFRLDQEDEIFLNTVGTFGVASAAFWWFRLAATLQRTLWVFLPLFRSGLRFALRGRRFVLDLRTSIPAGSHGSPPLFDSHGGPAVLGEDQRGAGGRMAGLSD